MPDEDIFVIIILGSLLVDEPVVVSVTVVLVAASLVLDVTPDEDVIVGSMLVDENVVLSVTRGLVAASVVSITGALVSALVDPVMDVIVS